MAGLIDTILMDENLLEIPKVRLVLRICFYYVEGRELKLTRYHHGLCHGQAMPCSKDAFLEKNVSTTKREDALVLFIPH